MSAQGYSGQNTPGITGGPGRGCLCPAGRGLRCRCVGLRGQVPFRLRREYLPGAFCALPVGALLLSKVYFFTLRDRVPGPFIASGGAPFLLAERGKRPPKGDTPFGNPHGQTNSGLRLRRPKGRACLRNRSLVALIKCLRRICMWSPSLPLTHGCNWHTNTRKANTLWASPWSAPQSNRFGT